MTSKPPDHSTNQSFASSLPALVAKGIGALQGLAAGDALGWPQEMRGTGRLSESHPNLGFRDWIRRAGGRFNAHEETILAGEYSDDTQLTFALGRARLTTTEWSQCFALRELPLFHCYQRGAGKATLRAIATWERATPPWAQASESDLRDYFAAGGNGSAMRSLPHALWHAAKGVAEDVIIDVHKDSVLTHGHPRALLGAAVYASAAHWLLRLRKTMSYGALVQELLDSSSQWGAFPSNSVHDWRVTHDKVIGSLDVIWQDTVAEIVDLLRMANAGLQRGSLADDYEMLSRLGCMGKWKGSATVTSVAAVYLASRHAARPTAGILTAAFAYGADTDTLAAMTGGLLGALNGIEWIPTEWLRVQDASALRLLAERMVSHRRTEGTWAPLDEAKVRLAVVNAEKDGSFELDSTLNGKLTERLPLYSKRRQVASTLRIVLNDGQTIYVKRFLSKNAQTGTPIENQSTISNEMNRELSGLAGDLSNRKPAKRTKSKLKQPIEDVLRWESVCIAVMNLTASSDFYTKLGFSIASAERHRISFGGFSISTFPADSSMTAETGEKRKAILIMSTSDLEVISERVLLAGGRETSRASESAEDQWRRFEDLDGNPFEVRERRLRL